MAFQFGSFGKLKDGSPPATTTAATTQNDAASPDEKDDNTLLDEPELATSDGGAARFKAIDVKSGEEDYNIVVKLKGKLFRFDEGENQWKERGQGEAKILKHKTKANDHVFILRREGTAKLGAYHGLMKGMKLLPHPSSEKAFVWTAPCDCSDEDEEGGHEEAFAIRFASKEMADAFKVEFLKICS